ncbi:MAG: hypothetical protein R2822_16990 [Spirosomataceae bacterium]
MKAAQTVILFTLRKSDFVKTIPIIDKNNSVIELVLKAVKPDKFRSWRFNFAIRLMLSPGSNAVVVLPGGYNIHLKDSWQLPIINANTCGTVGDLVPIQNACKAPGLWQSLKVQFKK